MQLMYPDEKFRESWMGKKRDAKVGDESKDGKIDWDQPRRPPALKRVEWHFLSDSPNADEREGE